MTIPSTQLVTPSPPHSEPVDDCAICLEPLNSRLDALTTLECNHTYHRSCIAQSMVNNDMRCPQCKHPIDFDQLNGWVKIDTLDELIAQTPDNAEWHNLKGIVLSSDECNQKQAGAAAFSRAIHLSPTTFQYWLNLGARWPNATPTLPIQRQDGSIERITRLQAVSKAHDLNPYHSAPSSLLNQINSESISSAKPTAPV